MTAILIALALRFNDLDERPMHADEATGARILSNYLETGSYVFDPGHFHGPTQTILTAPLARMRGEDSWVTLTEDTLRRIPAISGILLVLTPLLWMRWIGPWAAVATAMLMASSPLLVYYNRMFIHESLLVLFGFVFIPLMIRWLARPGASIGLLAGITFGLMVATKATFAISVISWLLAGFVCAYIYRSKLDIKDLRKSAYLKTGPVVVIAAAVTSILLYTNFMQNPSAAIDFVRTFFVYETVPGHEKPASYFLTLLAWPHISGRIIWWQGLVLVLAVAAVWMCLRKSDEGMKQVTVFLAISFMAHVAVYSMFSYKTPWLMMLPWCHAALLGGCAFSLQPDARPLTKILLPAVLALAVALNIHQSIAATHRFANDTRNPFAYVPTSTNVTRIGPWLKQLGQAVDPLVIEPIAVVGNAYWPLPWYLRDFDQIGYWPKAEPKIKDLAVVMVMPEQFEAAEVIYSASHTALPRSLRQDSPMMMYVRNDVWQSWMEADE